MTVLCRPLRKKNCCMALFLPRIHMRTRSRTLFQKFFLPFNCYTTIREESLGLRWQCFFSFNFTTFFFSFFPSFSLRFHLFLCIFSFFLSFPQQTETTEIKENSSTKWGWLQGTPDHEPHLADAHISRPLLSSATDSCSVLKFRHQDLQVFKTHIDFFFFNI